MPERRRLQRDSLIYFASKIIPGGMGLLSVSTFVRLVGYDQYGRYAVTLSVVVTLAALAAGWLSQGILRYLSDRRTPEHDRRFKQAVVAGVLLSSLAGCAGVGLIVWIFVDRAAPIAALAIALAAVVIGYIVASATLQARLMPMAVVAMEAARTVLAFVVPVIIIVLTGHRNHLVLLTGALVGYLAPLVVYLGIRTAPKASAETIRAIRTGIPPGSLPVLNHIWTYGWPVALWSLCNQGLSVSDRYMIQQFHGYAAAGAYASVYDVVVRSLSLMFFPITLATNPITAQHWNGGRRADALQVITLSIKYQLYLCIPIVVVWGTLGPWLNRLVFGPQSPSVANLVLPLAIGGCLWQLSLLIQAPLALMERTKQMLQAMAAAFLAGVSADYLLIPRFGALVAAYVNVAAAATYIIALLIVMPTKELRRQAKDRTPSRDVLADPRLTVS